ncbi:partitioning defective 3 homolog [Venturia canescens]|uniref:partitioning defective 3 homolog n=1 Tax=Venturia canescens TaxID=32260 RepID=UPI001C9D154E|nr:partitioning defective 3 homolog [Venturia canescens]
MKVTVCFDNVRVVVPCGDGTLLVRDLMHESILRYRKATGKLDSPGINSLSSLTGGGLLDPDDRLCDVADDREQIVAHLNNDVNHAGGDGASSVGTNSPDFFHPEAKERRYDARGRISSSNIKRESAKRLSMHALSTRDPHIAAYSALSLPRESRRREPLGQDSKISHEFASHRKSPHYGEFGGSEVREIVIKNEAGPLGLHVVPCYDLAGNDQGLRVEGIEPNGRIAKDGQIDLHDRIVKINGHNLLRIPFSKVQSIFASCMSEPCLRISVLKSDKSLCKNPRINNNNNNSSNGKDEGNNESSEKSDHDESVKKLQCHNILQSSNTRKIGRMIEIDLTKGNNGLGFSVTTRDNPAGGHCPIYIKNILPKGAAVEDGRLRPGDRLLEVNKVEMTGKSQSEVVSLLRSIPSGGKVRMIVSRQEEIGTAETSGVSGAVESTPDAARPWSTETRTLTPRGVKNAFEDVEKRRESTPPPYSSGEKCWEKTLPCKINEPNNDEAAVSPRKNRVILTLDIPVHDSEKAGLGVSVKGKTSHADENTNMDLGIFIKSVLNGGAASRDGRLRTNDQLLNVNGVSLLGLSNSDAMETLRRAMLNTNSSITGVITLTIARRISSYGSDKSFHDGTSPSCKIDTPNGGYMPDFSNFNNVRDKNSLNSQNDVRDSMRIMSATASPWNPVIDRLTEQYNKNSLRNESYCLATNKTWLNSVTNVKKLMLGGDNPELLLEESSEPHAEPRKNPEDRESLYSGGPAYDSQLSLEEVNSATNQFSRDALGRQSMSEKRHAALDAKNTDTYKRNKKLRDGRRDKSSEGHSGEPGVGDADKRNANRSDEPPEKPPGRPAISGESSSFETERQRQEKKLEDREVYRYGVPTGFNNKFLSPRKHWLVDDEPNPTDVTSTSHTHKDTRDGFTNARGDVKQASLNSALDERYKRSRKKGGIRSMLRLGKNRKSLNFGDNQDNQHESSNYCSGTINYIA